MKKYLVISLLATCIFAYKSEANSCCYEPPIGKGGEYATKEYVDSKVAEINARLDAIESRISKLKSELSNIQTIPAGLAEKVAALETAISDMRKTCPAECNSKLVKIEKDLAELKDKVEKRSKNMEKEVEKSMRK